MCSLKIKLEINNNEIFRKYPSIFKLNNTFPNNPLVKEEITEKLENTSN